MHNNLVKLWQHVSKHADERTRAELVEKCGCVLVVKRVALRQWMDRKMQEQKRELIGAETSLSREANGHMIEGQGSYRSARVHQSQRLTRRERERQQRARRRERGAVARILAQMVNPVTDGTSTQLTAAPNELQSWQNVGTFCAGVRKDMGVKSDAQIKPRQQQWVAVSSVNRSTGHSDDRSTGHSTEMGEQQFPNDTAQREVADGLLMIIPVRIFGRAFRALVDSGQRCVPLFCLAQDR